jgi:hypothetical protein
MQGNLICIATGRGDQCEAFCLDLDLAVQGGSFEEVRSYLNVAIESYMEAARAEPEPNRSRLLARKAPLWVRLTWAWRLFRSTISGRSDDNSTIEFPVACHA